MATAAQILAQTKAVNALKLQRTRHITGSATKKAIQAKIDKEETKLAKMRKSGTGVKSKTTMTAKQKANAVKFKQAIDYAKKHPNLSKKQAFAHVYGKRVLNGPAAKKTKAKRPSSPLKRQGVKAKPAPVRVTKKVVTRKVSIGSTKKPAAVSRKPSQAAMDELHRQIKLKGQYEAAIERNKVLKKVAADARQKSVYDREILSYKGLISGVNAQISTLKRAIK